jgi:hypothetical protein
LINRVGGKGGVLGLAIKVNSLASRVCNKEIPSKNKNGVHFPSPIWNLKPKFAHVVGCSCRGRHK